ncbi:hypothetical protein [Roseovarius aestuariivivens]|uniref:hypothetical protein n=1 Tax=Roseovarius aestuariivivens TaxID=1888910 RepID=UPI001081DB82|nr:hypothetical protein [Roseovarius aestuariivivens]
MTVTRIVEGLERSEATGPAAQDAARLGFLEWVFAHPGQVTAQTIRAAQAELSACPMSSDAACAFADVLRQAAPGLHAPGRRRVRRHS